MHLSQLSAFVARRARAGLPRTWVGPMVGSLLVSGCLLAQGVAIAQEELTPPSTAHAQAATLPEGFVYATEQIVVLRLTIDASGVVLDAEVVESAGDPFDSAAQAALLGSRFRPARRGDEPMAARVLYRYVFAPPTPATRPPSETEVEATAAPPPAAAAPPAATAPPAAPPTDEPELGVTATVAPDASGILERSAEAVQVVDTRALQHRAVDLGDVLAREEGVAVRRSGGLGSASRFSLAGLYDDQIRYFLDGVPLGVAGYPFGVANVPVSLVDRVELHRGVVPIRLGADALGGAVNLVTDRRYANHGVASYQTGSFGTYRASLHGRFREPRTGFVGGTTAFFDHANNDYPVDVEIPNERGRLIPTTVRRFHDAYTAFGASVDVGFVGTDWARRLILRGFGTGYAKDLQHNLVMTLPYGEARYDEQVFGGTLRYEQDDLFGAGTSFELVTALARRETSFLDVSQSVYDWTGRIVRERLIAGEVEGRPIDQVLWTWTSFTRVQASWSPSPEHTVRASVSPQFATRTGDDRLAEGERRDPLTAQRDLLTIVSGLSYRLNLFEDRLENDFFLKHYYYLAEAEEVLTGDVFRQSGRENHYAGVGNGLRVRLSEFLWLKASYEYATRLPRVDETFGNGVLIGPNLELEPETSHNVNFGAQLNLRDEDGTGRWRAEALLFARFTENLIVLLGTDRAFAYRNVFGATSLGVQGSAEWTSPGRYVTVSGNVTVQDQRNSAPGGAFGEFDGDRIPNRPWFFFNAATQLRWPQILSDDDAFRLGFDVRYVHGFFRGWESQGLREFKQTVDAQLLFGLSLTYQIDSEPGVSATLELQNLTDARVFDFFGVQRPGRSIFFKVTTRI